MSRKSFIVVKKCFAGFHSWPDAPEEVEFLKSYHRHVFHIQLKIEVTHADRDVEFFSTQRLLEKFMKETYTVLSFGEYAFNAKSCEMIAETILAYFQCGGKLVEVQVFEDNENGAIVVDNG